MDKLEINFKKIAFDEALVTKLQYNFLFLNMLFRLAKKSVNFK